MSKCEGDFVPWIKNTFGECIVTSRDKTAFSIGLISNLFWIVSSAPQMYQNCKTRVVEGQSPFFFSLLFIGNVLSLIGLFINPSAFITQYITGVIYVLMDGLLFTQYLIYTYCCPPSLMNPEDKLEPEEIGETSGSGSLVPALSGIAAAAVDYGKPFNADNWLGTTFGWIGTAIYMCSRVPQVFKNFKDKKVRDLSPFYVLLAIGGEMTYCLGVFIKSMDGMFLWEQAPWLAGNLGPMACDFIFLIQMCVFGYESTKIVPDEEEDKIEQLNEC